MCALRRFATRFSDPMGVILRFPLHRQVAPPALPPAPTPCIALGFAQDRFRVSILWGPGSANFTDYDKALSYAERLSRQRGWELVNLAGRAA